MRSCIVRYPRYILAVVGLLAIVSTARLVLSSQTPATAEGKPKRATFEIINEFTLQVPEGTKSVRVWFAVPQNDAESEIRNFTVEAPYPVQYSEDSQQNRVGYLEAQSLPQGPIVIRETFTLTRSEIRKVIDPATTRPLSDQERATLAPYLKSSTYVVVNEQIKALAEHIVAGEQNPVRAARKIYDWTLANITYWVKDPERLKASPVGSAEYCLQTKTGNCTDFHSLFSSLAMAAGLPTRMIFGSRLNPTLNHYEVNTAVHCWMQFYAPNLAWITLDVAVADIYMGDFEITEKNRHLINAVTALPYKGADPSMVNYYFGNLDERRVVWSTGRDLIMDPPQAGGPLNSLPTMYVEVDGKPYKAWARQLTYREVAGH